MVGPLEVSILSMFLQFFNWILELFWRPDIFCFSFWQTKKNMVSVKNNLTSFLIGLNIDNFVILGMKTCSQTHNCWTIRSNFWFFYIRYMYIRPYQSYVALWILNDSCFSQIWMLIKLNYWLLQKLNTIKIWWNTVRHLDALIQNPIK